MSQIIGKIHPPMTSQRKRQLFNVIGIFLSALFLYFCFRSLDINAVKQAFLLPRPWLLVGVLALNFVLMLVRTCIWSLLLSPLRSLPFWTLFDILHLGYMANNLLPLKAGEFFRATFVSKKWSLPYAQVLTTVGLERYFSGFVLILLLLLVASFLQIPVWIKTSAYVLGGILIAIQIGLILLWKKKPNLAKWEKRHPLIYRPIEFLYHVGEGSAPLRSIKSFLILMLLSLITWAIQIAMLEIIEAAFQVNIGLMQTTFVVLAINLAIALPSAPSNIGTFEFATILAYTWIGLTKATALGIGFYFHFLQVIPVTFIGLFYYFRWGIRLKDLEKAIDKKAAAIP